MLIGDSFLDQKLGDIKNSDNIELEEQAREEKSAALKEIAESRISVSYWFCRYR